MGFLARLFKADKLAKEGSSQTAFSGLSDQQVLEILQRLQKKHLQAEPLRNSDSVKELIENVVPKLANIQPADSGRIFAVYHRSINRPQLVILRACANTRDLGLDIGSLLEDYSVHIDDRYSVVSDDAHHIASIAVHNKGSASGRIVNVFVWREEGLYRFIGQRGAYTNSDGLTVRPG